MHKRFTSEKLTNDIENFSVRSPQFSKDKPDSVFNFEGNTMWRIKKSKSNPKKSIDSSCQNEQPKMQLQNNKLNNDFNSSNAFSKKRGHYVFSNDIENSTLNPFNKTGTTIFRKSIRSKRLNKYMSSENNFYPNINNYEHLERNKSFDSQNSIDQCHKNHSKETVKKTDKQKVMRRTFENFKAPKVSSLSSKICRLYSNKYSNLEMDQDSLLSKRVISKDFYLNNLANKNLLDNSVDIQKDKLETKKNDRSNPSIMIENETTQPKFESKKIKFQKQLSKTDDNIKKEMNSQYQKARNLSDCEDLDKKINFYTRMIESGNKKSFKTKEKKLETAKSQRIDLHKFAFEKFISPKIKTGFIFKKEMSLKRKIKLDLAKQHSEVQKIENDIAEYQIKSTILSKRSNNTETARFNRSIATRSIGTSDGPITQRDFKGENTEKMSTRNIDENRNKIELKDWNKFCLYKVPHWQRVRMQDFNDFYMSEDDIQNALKNESGFAWNPSKIITREFGFENMNRRKESLPFKVFDNIKQFDGFQRIETLGTEDFHTSRKDKQESNETDSIDFLVGSPRNKFKKKKQKNQKLDTSPNNSIDKKIVNDDYRYCETEGSNFFNENPETDSASKDKKLPLTRRKTFMTKFAENRLKLIAEEEKQEEERRLEAERVKKFANILTINIFRADKSKRNIAKAQHDTLGIDPLTKKPCRIIKNQNGKNQYSSYWLICIGRLQEYDYCTDAVDVGYFTCFNMDFISMHQFSSLPQQSDVCEKDFGEEFIVQEKILKAIYCFWKKIDYDIDFDDNRLCNHQNKIAQCKLNDAEPMWKYKVPTLEEYGIIAR